MGQRYPSIEIVRKKDFYTKNLKSQMFVNFAGQRIGEISLSRSAQFTACYYPSPDSAADYVRSCPTLYAAKWAIYKEWQAKRKSYQAKAEYLPASDNTEFYPTPSKLAGQMIALVDWIKIRSILEPSAGKGDLLGYAKNGTLRSKRYERGFDADCIEKDQNLRYVLTGKGFRVVHDDFLTYNTRKRYDLILMNPPFSDGDKHLLKALQMQENGGQIVCLVNAETIRNPYTNTRQLLSQKLAEFGAKIIFVKDAFKRAERRSDVEVAIVYVNIPAKTFDSEFFDRLHKARNDTDVDAEQPTAMVGGGLVSQLISQYQIEVDATLSLFREFNAMRPYIERGSTADTHYTVQIAIGGHVKDYIGNAEVNDYMRRVRGKYWNKLFQMPQLTDRFTSSILQEYRGSVDKMADYDFSDFNIQQIVSELNASLTSGVHAAINGLFDRMSSQHTWYPECGKNIHYFNGWATNKAHKINRKVILPINGFYSCSSWRHNELDTYHIYATLGDIEKVLDYLDQGATTEYSLRAALKLAEGSGKTKNIQCKYFSVTFYKKGTCHIVFHEQRIVDILNIYGARSRNWLPPDYGKRRYEDMSPDAQTVIDEFQGKAAYDEVMNQPGVYLPNLTTPLLAAAT